MKKKISSGSDFESDFAYSRAVIKDNWIFISGTTGFDYETMTIGETIGEQVQQCLENLDKTLIASGFERKDLIKVNYIFPDPSDFQRCRDAIQGFFEEVRPAATMISAGLADPRMKLEIEAIGCKE